MTDQLVVLPPFHLTLRRLREAGLHQEVLTARPLDPVGMRADGGARSSFYADPGLKAGEMAIVAEIRAITDEFEVYGYRRVGAELRHRGMVVNSKKVRRLMKENDLNSRRRRHFVRTTGSDHSGQIIPLYTKYL